MKSRTVYFWLLIALLCSTAAVGQGTFTAITSNSWNNPLSWSHTGVDGDNIPDADDTATIPSGITINMTGATNYQVSSLTILSGGTLNMNNANAVLDIFTNGGLLQVNNGGTIANPVNDDGNEINFLNNSSFVINGIVQTDLFEFEGLNQTVTITGGGTLLVRRFNVNNSGVTVNLNTSGSFGSSPNPFTVDMANLTINGTGTMDLGGGGDLNISASGLSIGCHINISDDIALIANSASLTITNGGDIDVADDLRVGPNATANNSTVTVNNGGTLTLTGSLTFNDAGTGSGDSFTFSNSGTVSITSGINFNSETLASITNSNLFTLGGSITNAPAASPESLTNAANATFNIEGNIDTDVTLNFTANGNTVNYSGGAQNIATTTYHNLTLSNTGVKTALGSFALRGNWVRSGAATFTPGANTVTFSALAGTAAQSISAVGGETFSGVNFNSAFATSPQFTLNNPVTVTTTLDLTSGIINLNGNAFTLGSSGATSDLNRTASTTTNWMYGGSFTRFWPTGQTPSPSTGNLYGLFPLGHSTASSYRPVAITAGSNITTTGSVTFNHVNASTSTDLSPVFDDDPTPGVINIVRKNNAQFIGTVSGVVGGTNYTISITMTGLATGTASDVRLAVSNGATTVTNVGTHVVNSGTAANPIVGRSAINAVANLTNDFRITTINTTNTPLPIELVSFKGEVIKEAVQLDWETASELNNDFFTVERSASGEDFSSIGQVNGGGTTNHGNLYSLTDHNPISGTAYYRLKQTDFDGTFTYSKIIEITYAGSGALIMEVYPNPSKGDQLNVRISGLKNIDSVPVVMYDQLGRECMRILLNVDKDSGTAYKEFPLESGLPQGIYLLKAGPALLLIKRLVVTSK